MHLVHPLILLRYRHQFLYSHVKVNRRIDYHFFNRIRQLFQCHSSQIGKPQVQCFLQFLAEPFIWTPVLESSHQNGYGFEVEGSWVLGIGSVNHGHVIFD